MLASVSRKLLLLPLRLAPVSMSGCSRTGQCSQIPLVEYSQQEQAKLRAEMKPMPADAFTPGFVTQSIELRDAVRACQGSR